MKRKSSNIESRTCQLVAVIMMLSSMFWQAPESQAQSLPDVGRTLWEVRYSNGNATGAIDYAPSTDLVFSGTENGRIFVVQGATGATLDTIKTDSWFLSPGGTPLKRIYDLSCSLDGSLLCISISLSSDYQGKVVLMEYPSKRIIMDSLYYGLNEWNRVRVLLSPSGRYVVVPNTGSNHMNRNEGKARLYDRVRDTSIVFTSQSYKERGDFDTDERYFVYSTLGTARGALVNNQVALLKLDDLTKPAKLYDEYGMPELSADGRYIMNVGLGSYQSGLGLLYSNRASVIDIEADSVVWKMDALPSLDHEGATLNDLDNFAWAEDASKLFVERLTTRIPAEWRGRIIYNVGDTVPKARMCDTCFFSGSFRAYNYGYASVANPQLTIGFSNCSGCYGLTAELLAPTTSVPALTPEHSGEGVYPNPATGEVRLRCNHVKTAQRWTLTTANGETAAQGTASSAEAPSKSECLIALPSALATGVFLITLTDSKQLPLCTHKVVKQ